MDVEVRSMISSDKKNAASKLNEYRDEVKQMQKDFQAAKYKAESLALTNGPIARQKLLTSNQRLDSSTATLEQSRQLIAQTEGIGSAITTDLEAQRELLQGANKKVTETKQYTTDAKGILVDMGYRAIRHKICMLLVIVILLGLIGLTGYYGFVKEKK
jgi:vesicle transport through interaction with t-SNAREs protein 1